MKLFKKELKLVLIFIFPTLLVTAVFAVFSRSEVLISAAANYSMLIGTFLAIMFLKKENTLSDIKKAFTLPEPIILLVFLVMGASWSVFSSQLFFAAFPYTEDSSESMTVHDILGTIVFAPLAEEMIFRAGFVALGKKYGKILPCAILSIVMFTAVHFADIPTSLSILGAAFIYIYVYIKTENLWYSILAHFVNNLISVIAYFVPILEKTVFNASNIRDMNNIYFISSAILIIICWFFLNKRLQDRT